MVDEAAGSIGQVFRRGLRKELPPRYQEDWREDFFEAIAPRLVSGVRILDVGSGADPTIPPDRRPADCEYVGLDISMAELQKAPAGSYDRMAEADVTQWVPELAEGFDLIVSWQVFEHVKPLGQAFDNLRGYLRPGGLAAVQMSGTFSLHGAANKVIPQPAAVWLLKKLLGRDPQTVFPAYYDKCWDRALEKILKPWNKAEIVPRWLGAGYLRFAAPLQAGYLAYEEWARRGGHDNLAPYYLVLAER
jgi:SAM-dependent methyltransferase